MEDGGAHTPAPQPWDKCPHPPQISEFFVWDWEGAQKCFILRDQTTGDLTFTSPGHTHSPVCAPATSFSFSRVVMWVICYYIGNLSQLCITVYSRNIILCVNFLGHSQLVRGGTCPPGPSPPPPLGQALQTGTKVRDGIISVFRCGQLYLAQREFHHLCEKSQT